MRAPAGVVDADDRRPDLDGMIHDLADLLCVGLGQRPAKHREVLAEDEHGPAVHGSVTGDHTVTRDALSVHPEVGAPMLDEHVPFLERARIKQQIDPFAGRQLAFAVLCVNPRLASPHLGRRTLLFKLLDDVVHASS